VATALVVAACAADPESTPTPSPLPTPTPAATVDASPSAAPSLTSFGEWRAAASMVRPRQGFDTVVLGDGTVLAVGDDEACLPGPAAPGSETGERYDPTADTWADVPSLNKPRKESAMVAMFDGSAMVLGGLNADDQPFSSTKQFEPETEAWTDGPLMVLGRAQPLAVTLPDGKVFVVSHTGAASEDPFTSEIMDPANGSWIETASLPRQTWIEQMVALADGTVLAVGTFEGDTESSPVAYVYDPAEDVWGGVQGLVGYGYDLVALPDGRALAIGGNDGGELAGGTGAMTTDVRRFEPGRGVWVPVSSLTTVRSDPQVAVLEDGRVLVAGGWTGSEADGAEALTSTELYDPTRDVWSRGSHLREPRYDGQIVSLADGSALILGGQNDFNTEGDTPWCPTPLVTTERLEPAP